MKGSLTVANLITSGNLAAGFIALILAEQGEYAWAAGCVGVAAAFDCVDGLVARRTHTECELGSQLDSLADLVSFGVAPALIMYVSVLHSLPVAGIGACLAFVLCGAWRLARFQTEEQPRLHFVGLPIPSAGLATVALATWNPPPGFALAMLLTLSLLMVCRLPFPTQAEFVRLRRSPRRGAIERAQTGSEQPRSRPFRRRRPRSQGRRRRLRGLRVRPRARRG